MIHFMTNLNILILNRFIFLLVIRNFKNTTKSEPCCENMKLENDNGESVCVSSGQVDRYDTVNVDIR